MESRRYEALDGLRGLVALAIVFYHAPIAHPLRGFAGWANWELLVDFFFVLSGFVLMATWRTRLVDGAAFRAFVARRFWRIWPLHFVILFAFFGIELLKAVLGDHVALPLEEAPFTVSRSWTALMSSILLLHPLNLHGSTTWNATAWSLSALFWASVIFGAAALAFRRHFERMLLPLALAALLVVAWISPVALFTTFEAGLFRALYSVFIGAAACRLVQSDRFILSGSTGLEIVVLLALTSYMLATGVNAASFFAPLVFAGVILVFSQGRGLVTAMLESRPLHALGQWSYAIVLVQALVWYGLRLGLIVTEKLGRLSLAASEPGEPHVFSFGSPAVDLAAIVALMVLTVVLAAKAHRFIERPFLFSRSPQAEATGPRHALPA